MTRAPRRFTDSYRTRLLLGYLAVVVVFGIGWGWSLYGPITNAVIAQQQDHLRSVAQAGALGVDGAAGDPQAVVKRLVEGTELRMTLVAEDGTVLADSSEDPATMGNHGNRPEVRAALAGSIGRDVRLSATQNVEQMYVAVPTTYRGQAAALRVSESLARINELSASARRTGVALLALAVALALLVVSRLATAAAAPVERLADAACSMAAGDLGSAVPDERGALRPLSEALGQLREQMRGRIADLESGQKSLRTVLDGLQDAVLMLEGDTVRVHNRAATSLFRATDAELSDRHLHDTPLPASLTGAVLERLGGTTTVVAELDPDPLGRSLRVVVVPLDPAGASARTLVIISDITERVTLDSVRRDFVANASHELKTPAAGILLLAQSAAHAASDGDTGQALSFLGQIEHEAERLRRLVLDLLDLSRLERPVDARSVTDLRQSVDLSLSAHRRAANEKGLALDSDFSAVNGQDVFVRAESADVAVALDNALANAVSYTERGGITIRVDADEARVSVTVADTGMGIPAADLPRVFERFYRVDRARSRDSGGTGLGLALVKHVVERSGGDVAITSSVGEGTSLAITFPRAR